MTEELEAFMFNHNSILIFGLFANTQYGQYVYKFKILDDLLHWMAPSASHFFW